MEHKKRNGGSRVQRPAKPMENLIGWLLLPGALGLVNFFYFLHRSGQVWLAICVTVGTVITLWLLNILVAAVHGVKALAPFSNLFRAAGNPPVPKSRKQR